MNAEYLHRLLEDIESGKQTVEEVYRQLKAGPLHMEANPLHVPDHHRLLRNGLAEVIYAAPKKKAHLLHIAEKYCGRRETVLFTRLRKKQLRALQAAFPEALFNESGRTMILNAPPREPVHPDEPFILILSAGTSDVPVVEEAAATCRAMGMPYHSQADVGVAGLHRVLQRMEMLQKAAAIVVVAGMEGALPSVVGGLVDCPVFAVPTSVGYGAGFKGLSALLGMLNSCAPGVMVANIDNGFSAAFAAGQVIRMIRRWSTPQK
ncbi:MAG: nickel pincer cofactor biosynthesis protein LarB [Calditrichaeota bacterium]|nr:MAG: nickel pincer cofactor biosynthesis protein LarB [Calditrichota bacterium]